MGITRLHIALLAIMCLFTGIIAPGVSTDTTSLAYPMTDASILTYTLLFFLIIGFYTASIHSWRLFRYTSILIIGIVGLLFFLTLTGQIIESRTGLIGETFSWGWIFLALGIILLIRAYFDKGGESTTELRQTIDTLLGIVGSFTLACIAGVIILISLNFSDKSHQMSILEARLGTGSIETMSGDIILSLPYTEITALSYDRKKDILIYSARTGSLWETTLIGEDGQKRSISGSYYTPFSILGKLYTYDTDSRVYSGTTLLENTEAIGSGIALLSRSGSDWTLRSDQTTWSLDSSGAISNPILSRDHRTLAWYTDTLSGGVIYRMGKPEGEKYEKVYSLNISDGGYDLMSMVSISGSLSIVKNGALLWKIHDGYITGSYQSNGSHSSYIRTTPEGKELIIDGQKVGKTYDEIREVLLEKNGGSYAYFARPLGSNTYCFYSRYRGNLCGLEGYMNPDYSADGTSIIYVGYTNGVWSIYRNSERLVTNTGYSNGDISGDYFYFDATNPRSYVFLKKEGSLGYTIIKNGRTVPGIWKDVGLSVSFGYDNHILLPVRDSVGWRIAEI